jgi:hypothetical protein
LTVAVARDTPLAQQKENKMSFWSWFKKAAHYVAVGVQDVEKFLQTSGALNLLSILPMGGAVQAGIGVFEKILGGVSQVEQTAAAWNQNNGTGPQKLIAATPDAIQALLQLANAAGMKVTDQVKLQSIAAALASAGADFWNIVEPISAPSLPTPPTPAPTPAATPKP